MNNNLVEAVLIVDRSGSMGTIAKQTIMGINEFIQEQKKSDKNVKITVALFDNEYLLPVDGVLAENVQGFTNETYVPRGMTALYDAIGRTIDNVGNRLANTPENERPSKVLIAIFTDGYENASTDYSSDLVKERIEHQTNKYGWDFVFIGANQDAILTAGGLGIGTGSALTYAANDVGVYNTMRSFAAYTNNLYNGDDAEFTLEDRAKAMEG